MTDLAIVIATDDENPVEGDLRLVDGQLVLVSGTDAIRQDLAVRLRWFKGEWFLDRRTGVPWFQSILGHRASTAAIERILRTAIRATPGVSSITRLSIDTDNVERTLTVDFEVRTNDGDSIEFTDFILPTDLPEGT